MTVTELMELLEDHNRDDVDEVAYNLRFNDELIARFTRWLS